MGHYSILRKVNEILPLPHDETWECNVKWNKLEGEIPVDLTPMWNINA